MCCLDNCVKSSSPPAPASTLPPCSDPSPRQKSVPDVPVSPVVAVPLGQSKGVVSDPSSAPITYPKEPTLGSFAHLENTKPEKEAEPSSDTMLPDSSVAPAVLTPTLAPTVSSTFDPEVILVINCMCQ